MKCCRSAVLTQLFAVVDSDPLTLVAYNGRFLLGASIVDTEMSVELVNGAEELINHWEKKKHVCISLPCVYIGKFIL